MKLVLFLSAAIIVLVALLLQSKHGYLSNKAKLLKIKELIRSAEQFSRACKEDKDNLSALLHANSGASYLAAARNIMPDQEIDDLSLSSTSIAEFAEYVDSLVVKYYSKISKHGVQKG